MWQWIIEMTASTKITTGKIIIGSTANVCHLLFSEDYRYLFDWDSETGVHSHTIAAQ